MSDFDDNALYHRIANGDSLDFDYALFDYYAKIFNNAFYGGWQKKPDNLIDIGIEYGYDDPAMLTAFETNIFRFSASKTLEEVQLMNQSFRAAKSFADFEQKVSAITGKYRKDWLRTEYNTAVTVGENTALFHRLRKQSDIFPYWKFKTQEDAKVRPAHRELDNLVLEQKDERWNRLFPPLDWNCRCYVVPLTKGDIDGTDWEEEQNKADNFMDGTEFSRSKANGFGVNRADTGQVFTEDQFYTRKFPGKAKKALEKLNYTDYNLPAIDKVERMAAMPEYTGTPSEFYKKLEVFEGEKIIRDYNNRPIAVPEKGFNEHTSDVSKKRAHRAQYLDAMKQTLENPDEVWLNDQTSDKMNRYQYVKHYFGTSINVSIEIGSDLKPQVKTWFPMTLNKKSVVNNYRRGLLIESKKASTE